LRLAQHSGELADRGGLAGTLQAGHQNDCRWLCGQIQPFMSLAHELGKFAMNDPDQCLSRAQRADHLLADGLFLDGRNQLLHHRQGDIGLKQRQPDLSQRIGDVGFGQARLALEGLHDARKALGQVVEHGDSCMV